MMGAKGICLSAIKAAKFLMFFSFVSFKNEIGCASE